MKDGILVHNAVKRFRDTVALDHVEAEFAPGLIHGVIGRNGSGKTVLFKSICGFLALDEGEIMIDGERVAFQQPQKRIGLIIEEPGFVPGLSGLKNLRLLAALNGKLTDEARRQAMRDVGLDPDMKKRVERYSLGMKQRLGLAQAIMERPELLILDEPMNGLDKQGVREVRALLKRLKDEGTTILLASHYAEDVDALCDTVWEMEAGGLTRVE